MMEEGRFWKNKIWGIRSESFEELMEKINKFYEHARFITDTQVFCTDRHWYAVIRYKVRN